MAIYRTICLSFWTDTKVVDTFTPEDKYFYLYCLTNPHTNLCGCYEISKKQMATELGYSIDSIDNLLDRFKNKHKIICLSEHTNEILVLNWHKYNWTNSPKFRKPLYEEIQKIKDKTFKEYLNKLFNGVTDTVSIPYQYRSDTSVTVTDTVTDINKIIKTYEEEIGLLTPYQLEILQGYLEELSEEMIIEAIKRSSKANKKSMAYIEGILKNWIKDGYKKLEDIKDIRKDNKKEYETINEDLSSLYDN